VKATLFVTGVNRAKGAIDDPEYGWDKVIQRMHAEGHQVASHTWSHADLSKITPEQRRDEMIKLEMALRNILGFYPTYMRPPYSSCNEACLSDMADWGYVSLSFVPFFSPIILN
jgi:peptidoglycan/xylan/chitin deacetylase (PgdA/CDA1 family)